ncbi:MAG TPA: NADH-quinone oxidoreductase subunit C [Candidatus Aerophobetes bacterium]|uniref:NADH-quinone oxidoreductase n=1 Tax=Aerophobetes bacterium TaxID=2030807 RepID=A0A7V0N1J0_UNCAE|nr:NADH-quinone oxidoreductase subunit C [Candidatus Aerophobetes bacterium]
MAKKDIVEKVKEHLKDRIVSWEEKSSRRHYFTVKKADIVPVARYLFEKAGARFITASGVDTPKGIEILYHFSFDREGGKVVTVKVLVPKDKCEIESITPVVLGAIFIEREIKELLGVKFLNHPDPRPLLTAENWPRDVYPLRLEYRDANFPEDISNKTNQT